jgi:hypothetical protein
MDEKPAPGSHGVQARGGHGGRILLPPRGDLCPECQTIVDADLSEVHDDKDLPAFPHHTSRSAFEECSQAGCCLCYQFIRESDPAAS